MPQPIKVFCSYRSVDRTEVNALVDKLIAAGIDAWFDRYEITAGDDIVQRMGAGLDGCQAALIFFSSRDARGAWFNNEVSTLVCRRNDEGIRVIPVMIDAAAAVPGLLKPLARRGLDDIEQIVDAIRGVSRKPRLGDSQAQPRHSSFTLRLVGPHNGTVDLVAVRNREEVARVDGVRLTHRLQQTYAEFVQGRTKLAARGPEEAKHATLSRALVELGDELGAVLFQGAIGVALRDSLKDVSAAESLDLCFQANDPALLALPFEAVRLDNDTPALRSGVRVLRRVEGVKNRVASATPAPLKILVAIGAPDEDKSKGPVLDLEHELQGVLDALSPRMEQGNADVRILEVGSPDQIEKKLAEDPYHVLHLSGHGHAGVVELENEEGGVERITAAELVQRMQKAGRNVPLVFLSSCHGGLATAETTSFATSLVREGVPYVIAMQTSVTDRYASALAKKVYAALAAPEFPHPSHALAVARQELEQERLAAIGRGAPALETQPEYATASLFVGAEEIELVDYSADKQPLSTPPVHKMAGPVPVLSVGDLVGRRSELRAVLRVLRDHPASLDELGKRSGVVLTGIGGVGKSSLAGRAMTRLKEDGWIVAPTSGTFSVSSIAAALGGALRDHSDPKLAQLAGVLAHPQLDDQRRMATILELLQTRRVVLVLDNFEDNLAVGGGRYLDEATLVWMRLLCQHAQTGKLLVTSRYPLPELDVELHHQPLGPLTPAQVRKLMWRHPGLRDLSGDDAREVLRHIGGHPRMLEFLDGILRKGRTRLPSVATKMRDVAKGSGLKLRAGVDSLDDAVRVTAVLGARDILLDELVNLARADGDEEALLQCAVSSLPVTATDLAHALGDMAPGPRQIAEAQQRLERLADLSLATAMTNAAFWVHRWTADALLERASSADTRARFARAGRARLARGTAQGIAFDDISEATQNFLDAELWDDASSLALQISWFLQRSNQSIAVVAFAGQVLRLLPVEHVKWAALADVEAESNLALGFTSAALTRYQSLLTTCEARVTRWPNRADYQRALSIICNKLGDLMRVLGQGEQAREFYERSLLLRENLAKAEPDDADHQRDLCVSYDRSGDLMRSLGQGAQARELYERAIAIMERLARAEPGRADYQRDLSVFYNKLGELTRALGQGERAREFYEKDLAIAERLAKAEPDRADYQRDLSVSYSRLGDLMRALGHGEQAREFYEKDLAIAERLTEVEPERADYQRDLSVSYNKLGDLKRALGQSEQAREFYERAHSIAERLAKAEPDRADYQRDLSVSYNKLGDLMRSLGEAEQAHEFFQRDLAIAERLAKAEPDRADYRRDLSVSYIRLGDLLRTIGQGEQAREFYEKDLAIAERLVKAEPDIADHQRDLAVSLERSARVVGDAAGELLARAAKIRSRLANAEPERADLQLELAQTLAQLALNSGTSGFEHADRALSILYALRDSGRLAPRDAGMIASIEALRDQLAKGQPPAGA